VTQGTGEDLLLLTADELGDAIDHYIDKGPDFIKYGGTAHWWYPTLIPFSAAAQRAIVERAHRRGLSAETHSTSLEGLRQSVEAGIDLIQHPETMNGPRELTDDLVTAIKERGVICSVIPGMLTAQAWARHLEKERNASARHHAAASSTEAVPDTAYARRRRTLELDAELATKRRNIEKLIAAGCRITVGADTYIDVAPEFGSGSRSDPWFEPGLGVAYGLEGLVELGMTPLSALQAATRTAAAACRREAELGTLEAGKEADVVVLDADPLRDIGNVRRISLVISRGCVADFDRLPRRSVYERVR
jgi:imidazolonepropionase-like amidohydrolase